MTTTTKTIICNRCGGWCYYEPSDKEMVCIRCGNPKPLEKQAPVIYKKFYKDKRRYSR